MECSRKAKPNDPAVSRNVTSGDDDSSSSFRLSVKTIAARSVAAVPRVRFYVLGAAFVLLVVGSVAALVAALQPMIDDQRTEGVEAAVRGAYVAVAERVSGPFRFVHTTIKMHAADTRASGDSCADGRVTLEQSRRFMRKYAASIETSRFPLWITYHMFRVPRPSGETWTFCECSTTGAHGYHSRHCDGFNQTHLVSTDLGLPMNMTEVHALSTYNRTSASYMPPIHGLREGIDDDGVWTEPVPFVYPSGRIGVSIAFHIPVRFQYNWEFDVSSSRHSDSSSVEEDGGASSEGGSRGDDRYTVLRPRTSPPVGLNASDPRLSLPGQPFHRKISLTESVDVLLEGIREFLVATAPEHAQVALVHAQTGLLVATTFPIPLFDQSRDYPAIWPCRSTPDPELNAIARETLDVKLVQWRLSLFPADGAAPRETSMSFGIPGPMVFGMADRIVTAGLFTPTHGLVLCLITVTQREAYYASVDRARLLTFGIAGFAAVVLTAAAVVLTVLLHRSFASLGRASAVAATLQLDSEAFRRATAGSVVAEIAELEEAFAAMNDALCIAGTYLPHGVRTEWLLRRRQSDDSPPLRCVERRLLSEVDRAARDAGELDAGDRPQMTTDRSQAYVPSTPAVVRGLSERMRLVAVLQLNVVGFHTMLASSTGRRRHRAAGRGANAAVLSSPRAVDHIGPFVASAIARSSSQYPRETPSDGISLNRRGLRSRGADNGGGTGNEDSNDETQRVLYDFSSDQSMALFLADDAFAFLGHLTEITTTAATRHGGVLDSFQGDRFTVTFNAVNAVRAPELRAFCCAASIRQHTQALRYLVDDVEKGVVGATVPSAASMDQSTPSEGRAHSSGRVEVPISCGIAAGPAAVGPIGSNRMRRLGVIGHPVGDAAMLERLCRTYTEIPKAPRAPRPKPQRSNAVEREHESLAVDCVQEAVAASAPRRAMSLSLLVSDSTRSSSVAERDALEGSLAIDAAVEPDEAVQAAKSTEPSNEATPSDQVIHRVNDRHLWCVVSERVARTLRLHGASESVPLIPVDFVQLPSHDAPAIVCAVVAGDEDGDDGDGLERFAAQQWDPPLPHDGQWVHAFPDEDDSDSSDRDSGALVPHVDEPLEHSSVGVDFVEARAALQSGGDLSVACVAASDLGCRAGAVLSHHLSEMQQDVSRSAADGRALGELWDCRAP